MELKKRVSTKKKKKKKKEKEKKDDKSRHEVTRGDKKVLDAFTDTCNVKYHILVLFARV